VKPYYNDDWVTIYNKDCRDMSEVPDGSVDIVNTSPPYNVGINYGDGINDKRSEAEFREWTAEWLRVVYARAMDPSRFYLWLSDRMLWWCKPLCEDIGWRYHQMLTWCKPNISGSTKKVNGDWNFMTEPILLFRRGKRTPMVRPGFPARTFSWFVGTSPQSTYNGENRRVHPAQFPEAVVRQIIGRTPGEVVLDPFLGSGTTAIAAKTMGRHCIGYEVSERYCEVAARRCSQSVLTLPPSCGAATEFRNLALGCGSV